MENMTALCKWPSDLSSWTWVGLVFPSAFVQKVHHFKTTLMPEKAFSSRKDQLTAFTWRCSDGCRSPSLSLSPSVSRRSPPQHSGYTVKRCRRPAAACSQRSWGLRAFPPVLLTQKNKSLRIYFTSLLFLFILHLFCFYNPEIPVVMIIFLST